MLGFAMQVDSSLMLRMTLTQCFKNLNCHSEAERKNLKPQQLEMNHKKTVLVGKVCYRNLRTDFIELYAKLSFFSCSCVFVKNTFSNGLVNLLEC